jgi:hypothetical protein
MLKATHKEVTELLQLENLSWNLNRVVYVSSTFQLKLVPLYRAPMEERFGCSHGE